MEIQASVVIPVYDEQDSERAKATNRLTSKHVSPRITVLVEYLPPHMGSDYRIYKLSKELTCRNFEINFIVFPPLRFLCNVIDSSLKSYMMTREKEASKIGLKAVYLDTPPFLRPIWSQSLPLAYSLSFAYYHKAVMDLLKVVKPDIVLAAHPSYLCGLVGIVAARQLNIPVIVDYPDLWTPMTLATVSWKKGCVKSAILQSLEDISIKLAKHVVVVSPFIRTFLLEKGISSSKVSVIPNGVSISEVANIGQNNDQDIAYNNNTNTVLFVGRLERWSGVDCLIRAMPPLIKAKPETRLTIVGGGSYEKSLKSLVFSLGIEKIVEFTGFLDRDKVWNLIKNSNVCVSVFSKGSTSDAAMPIKLLEYMALGKAIITTEVKGMSAFLKDSENVLLVEWDPDSISSAILTLLSDNQKACLLGSNAEKIVKKYFDWSFLAEDYSKVCSSVITNQDYKTATGQYSLLKKEETISTSKLAGISNA